MPTKETIYEDKITIAKTAWYAICIDASCATGSQMRVCIDQLEFREIPPFKNAQRFTIPAAWNGNILRGKTQRNYYILQLSAGDHIIKYVIKGSINEKKTSLRLIESIESFILNLDLQAENLNKQPFINVILVDLPVASVSGTAIVGWNETGFFRRDEDDIKVRIDGKYYSVNADDPLWRGISATKSIKSKQHRVVSPDLEKGLHYIELLADCSPTIQTLRIDTQPTFKGDYWLQLASKKVKNARGKEINKTMLGVKFPDDTPILNNNDYELSFDENQFALSDGKVDTCMPDWVDEHLLQIPYDWIFTYINLESAILQEGNWHFYGIDTGWKLSKEFKLELHWQDASRWKLMKKQ